MINPLNVLQMVPPIDADKSKGVKDERGRWIRGPGRVLGSKNKQSSELMKSVRAMGNRAVQNLSDALDAKEQWATTLVLKYCLPGARTVEMHGAEPDDIKQAFLEGDLSADEMKAVATAIEKLKSVADIDDLRERLAELEMLLATKTG